MKHTTLLIFLFIGLLGFIWLHISTSSQLKCIISSVDGEKYCVRERKHIKPAANLLAKVANQCKSLVEHMGQTYPNNLDVKRLVERFDAKRISETLPTSEHTAYSENKGEKIAFCLTRKKHESKLIDINTLTFVAIHELAHIMTVSEGHQQVFWKNFKFLLENAVKAGIYHPEDYKSREKEYCGMPITDNPLYDF